MADKIKVKVKVKQYDTHTKLLADFSKRKTKCFYYAKDNKKFYRAKADLKELLPVTWVNVDALGDAEDPIAQQDGILIYNYKDSKKNVKVWKNGKAHDCGDGDDPDDCPDIGNDLLQKGTIESFLMEKNKEK